MLLLDHVKTLLGNKNLNAHWRFKLLGDPIEGSSAKVHQVQDKKTGEVFALKVLYPNRLRESQARFEGMSKLSEAKITAKVQHPNIIELREDGLTLDEEPYLLLEWFEGKLLSEVMRYSSEVAGKRLTFLRHAAEALAAVHRTGLLHRNPRPEKFLVNVADETLKLFDFGTAVPNDPKYIRAGARLVHADYAPPETLKRDAKTNATVEVFAFGVTAYQLFTGRLPWPYMETTSVARAMREAVDIRQCKPSMHPVLAEAIMSCLENNPRARPQSMDEFLRRIASVESEEASSPAGNQAESQA
ncbi:MAG: serine/threonine protein kinase [Planctomycetales bacterium]